MEIFQIAKRKQVCAKTLHFGYIFIRFFYLIIGKNIILIAKDLVDV